MSERGVAASELLADEEIELLRRSLLEWGGPAWCSDQLAVGMGFAGMEDLFHQCRRLRGSLKDDLQLVPVD
ncbi:hypothetical protein [Streptomyces mirabilis]|uniref:hypothetical protein n=1 Tax=Streptomyces mirabilis TaxID=68239 RepID=UPI003805FAC5